MKKDNVVHLIALFVLTALQVVVACVDFVLWLKIALAIILFVGVLITIVLKTKAKIKRLKREKENLKNNVKPNNNLSLLDMYAILKIAPQYNADGTLKDIYQLLKIEPQYDENGNRIVTIYERLGINPNIDKNGDEIPRVVVIKNRVNALVKLKAAPMPLVYVPREQLIAGYTPVIAQPIVGAEKPSAPSIKQVQVVKMPPKPAKEKPKPASKPKLPGKSKGISISKAKIAYESPKGVLTYADSNIFAINSKNKPAPKTEKVNLVTDKDKPLSTASGEPTISKVTKVSSVSNIKNPVVDIQKTNGIGEKEDEVTMI